MAHLKNLSEQQRETVLRNYMWEAISQKWWNMKKKLAVDPNTGKRITSISEYCSSSIDKEWIGSILKVTAEAIKNPSTENLDSFHKLYNMAYNAA